MKRWWAESGRSFGAPSCFNDVLLLLMTASGKSELLVGEITGVVCEKIWRACCMKVAQYATYQVGRSKSRECGEEAPTRLRQVVMWFSGLPT